MSIVKNLLKKIIPTNVRLLIRRVQCQVFGFENDFKNIASSFLLSEEFQLLYGYSPSDQEYITNLYQNVLNRTPDVNGFNYWLKQMQPLFVQLSMPYT